MSNENQTSENFFRKAAESLPGHWHKGNYTDGQGNYCLIGHLLKVRGYSDEEIVSGYAEGNSVDAERIEFLNVLAIKKFPERTTVFVADFNDHADTTEEEVVAFLSDAASEWDHITETGVTANR